MKKGRAPRVLLRAGRTVHPARQAVVSAAIMSSSPGRLRVAKHAPNMEWELLLLVFVGFWLQGKNSKLLHISSGDQKYF
jgi:hypothetical protein